MVLQISPEERSTDPKVFIGFFTNKCGVSTGPPLLHRRTLPDPPCSATEFWTAPGVSINEASGGNELDLNHHADALVDANVIVVGWNTYWWVDDWKRVEGGVA